MTELTRPGGQAPRILLVPAFLSQHGGLENHVITLARLAADLGAQVQVVTPRPIPPGGGVESALRQVAEVAHAEGVWRRRPVGRGAAAVAGLRAAATERRVPDADRRPSLGTTFGRGWIERFWETRPGRHWIGQADLVHAIGKPKPFVASAVRAANRAGKPVVYSEIAQVTEEYADRPDLRGFAEAVNHCDLVTVFCEQQGRDIRTRFGYRGEIVEADQWCFEHEDDLLAIERSAQSGAGPTFGSLCRLSPEKDLPTLLRAFARAFGTAGNAQLRVAGTGPLGPDLEQEAARLGISERVDFTGFVADLPTFYRDVDAFVIASIEEGGPITGVEAMAAGLPIVTTPVGAMPERLAPDQRLSFDAGDDRRLADHLVTLATDTEVRAQVGRAARVRYLERNHSTVTSTVLEDVWHRLLDRRASRVAG